MIRVHGTAADPPAPWGMLSQIAAQSHAVDTGEHAWQPAPLSFRGGSGGSSPPEAAERALPAAVHDTLAGYLRSGGRSVIVADDAQWADKESLAALMDLGWRLRSARLLIVVAYRVQGRSPLLARAGRGAPQAWRRMLESRHAVLLPLEGLPPEDILRLAVASGRHGLSVRAAARLHQASGGNPDYLLDLFPLLSSNPIVIDEGPLPLPANRAAGIMSRFAACGPRTRQLLCAAAVLGQRFSVAMVRDVVGVQEPWTHIYEAMDHALVEVVPATDNRELRFPGRVIGEAIYWSMSERERARWHRRCAGLGGPDALRHRIAAADGVDEALAADLRRAARERMRTRDLGGAAYYLQHAMDRTERGPARTALLLQAVEALLAVGRVSAAMQYAGELEQAPGDPWRDYVLGYLLMLTGNTGQGTLLLRGALAALDGGDPLPDGAPADLRARIAAQLGVLGSVRLSYGQTIADGEAAMTAGSDDAAVRGLATVAKTLGMALAGDGPQALALLADAGEPGSASGIEGLAVRGVIRLWIDDLDGAASDLHAVFRRCAHGAALRTSQAVAYLGEVEYRRGHLREAAHFAGLAVDNATDDDRHWCRPALHALAVYPHAALADWERATQHAAEAEAMAQLIGEPAFLAYAACARAAIAHARGAAADLLSAADVIETVYDSREPGTHLFGPVRADALAQLGHFDEATDSLHRFLSGPGAVGRKSARMTAARVAAEIAIARGDYAQAVRACERARALAAEIGLPLEAARASLTEARSLYLRGKHAAAEQTVRSAHGEFIALGATAYAELAERRAAEWDMRVDDILAALTSRESQICVLAAKGLTSAAIGRRLGINVKTVESHRTSAYRKLGLRSLGELKRLLGS